MSTPRIARVVIVNASDFTMEKIRLVHCFGDKFSEVLEWSQVKDEKEGAVVFDALPAVEVPSNTGGKEEEKPPFARSRSLNVNYSTGFGSATSWDWWSLTWENPEILQHESDGKEPQKLDGKEYGAVPRGRVLNSTVPSWLTILSDHFLVQSSAMADLPAELPGALGLKESYSGMARLGCGLANLMLGDIARTRSKNTYCEFTLHEEDAYDPKNDEAEIVVTVHRDCVKFETNHRKELDKSTGKPKPVKSNRSKKFEYSSLELPPAIAAFECKVTQDEWYLGK